MKEPILRYPDPKKPYVLFTNASKYVWTFVLLQSGEHEIDGKIILNSLSNHLHVLHISW